MICPTSETLLRLWGQMEDELPAKLPDALEAAWLRADEAVVAICKQLDLEERLAREAAEAKGEEP